MSSRDLLFEQSALPKQYPTREKLSISLFQDNDSGSWRLFLNPSFECVDLSLPQLRELVNKMNAVITNIDADPWNNAEFVRDEYAKMDVSRTLR